MARLRAYRPGAEAKASPKRAPQSAEADAILACLGQMYAGDPRFQQNLDQYGPGAAQKMSAAIAAYCKA